MNGGKVVYFVLRMETAELIISACTLSTPAHAFLFPAHAVMADAGIVPTAAVLVVIAAMCVGGGIPAGSPAPLRDIEWDRRVGWREEYTEAHALVLRPGKEE